MQKFKFPMEYLRVTQGENNGYSHAGSLAMDFGGKDTGADKLYCPCDMIVKRCRHNANGELYLESVEKVQFADGTSDYARLLCIHDNAFNVTEGQVLKQGDYFYDEGGMGAGKANAFGTHVHIEAGKGKWKSCTQSLNAQGTYVIENQSHLYDLFILGSDVKLIDDGGYFWKMWKKTDKYLEVIGNKCEYFNSANVYDVAGKLPNGTIYECTEISTQLIDNFIWVKFKKVDGEYYAVILDDRSKLVDAPSDTDVEIEKLTAELKVANRALAEEKMHNAQLVAEKERLNNIIKKVKELVE